MAERPGRPAVGPMVNVRFPEDLLAALDQIAANHGLSRAATIRMILIAELEDPAGGYGGGVGYSSRYVEKAQDQSSDLTITGRNRALIEGLAKHLQGVAKKRYDYTPLRYANRGFYFEVRIDDPDGDPTGHVARVTVELDHVEPVDE